MIQMVVRIACVLAILLIFARVTEQKNTDIPRAIPETFNRDLQLLRLYHRTNGVWTDTDLAEYEKIVGVPTPVIVSPLASIEILLLNNEWDNARLALENTLQSDPQNPQANFWLGALLLPDSEAKSYFEIVAATENLYQGKAAKILSVMTVEGYSLNDLGIRLVEAQEWALAERIFTLQIQANNLDSIAYTYRGFVRDQQGKDGFPDLEMANALDPALSLAYYMIGLHYRQRDQLDKSLDAFLSAHLLDPENPSFASELGMAYQLNYQLDLAELWYGKAVALSEGNEGFVTLQVIFYVETQFNLQPIGITVIQQAAGVFPDNTDILACLGQALLLQNKMDESIAALNQAYVLAPDSPRVNFYLGLWWEKQGNYAEALSHYLIVIQTQNLFTEQAQFQMDQFIR